MDFEQNLKETKKNKKYFRLAIVVVVLAAVFLAGLGLGQKRFQIKSGKVEISKGIPPQNADYSLLWEALEQLNAKFVDRPLDQQKLLYGAINGLVSAVDDPYTVFFDPEQSKQFAEELQGSFEGVGMEIGVKNEQIVVIAPLEGTPAASAGILPGDIVLAIDGESTAGMTADKAVTKIRGKAGTQVLLQILHQDQKTPKEIKITRARIEVKSVKFETKEISGPPGGEAGKKIGVVKMNRFGEDTKGLLDHALDVILFGNYNGVVLDLRNNPGGYLDVAVTTASNWVESGKIVVKEVSYDNKEKEYTAKGVARLQGMKTVVLVNEGSASASEILAGALQDYGLATIVGEKTFGKGSVQELVNLRGDSTLKVTIAKWQTPKGRDINKNGLEPDIKVERTAKDFEEGKDPQMDKALELLK